LVKGVKGKKARRVERVAEFLGFKPQSVETRNHFSKAKARKFREGGSEKRNNLSAK